MGFNHAAGGSAYRTLVNEKNVNLLAAGFEVKYLIMLLCIAGVRQQQRTTALTAMIPKRAAFGETIQLVRNNVANDDEVMC